MSGDDDRDEYSLSEKRGTTSTSTSTTTKTPISSSSTASSASSADDGIGESKERRIDGVDTFAWRAYRRIVLHACKWPSRAVIGVVIGRRSSLSSSVVTADTSPIIDSIGIAHSIATAPLLEMAMIQIDEYCRQASRTGVYGTGVEVEPIGVYTANSRIDDRDVGHAAMKLANKLVEHYPAAAILLVDNTNVAHEVEGKTCTFTLRHRDGRWKQADGKQWYFATPDTLTKTRAALREGSVAWHNAVYDLEDHLDDTSLRWLP